MTLHFPTFPRVAPVAATLVRLFRSQSALFPCAPRQLPALAHISGPAQRDLPARSAAFPALPYRAHLCGHPYHLVP